MPLFFLFLVELYPLYTPFSLCFFYFLKKNLTMMRTHFAENPTIYKLYRSQNENINAQGSSETMFLESVPIFVLWEATHQSSELNIHGAPYL